MIPPRSSYCRGSRAHRESSGTTSIVDGLITTLGKRYGVKVYEKGNSGNHLHLLLRATTRSGFRNFMRLLSGQLAMKITGSRRGRPLPSRFWKLTFWSRIVEWGKAFAIARTYVKKNELEGQGIIPHERPHRRKTRPIT